MGEQEGLGTFVRRRHHAQDDSEEASRLADMVANGMRVRDAALLGPARRQATGVAGARAFGHFAPTYSDMRWRPDSDAERRTPKKSLMPGYRSVAS
jgi:hypothetical protein